MPPSLNQKWESLTGRSYTETASNLRDRAIDVLMRYDPDREHGLYVSLQDPDFQSKILAKFEGCLSSYTHSLLFRTPVENYLRYKATLAKLVTIRIMLNTMDNGLKEYWISRNPGRKHHIFTKSAYTSLEDAVTFFKQRTPKVERRGRKEDTALAWAVELFVDVFEQVMGRRFKRDLHVTEDNPPRFSNQDCVFIYELIKVIRPEASVGNVKTALLKLEPLSSEK